MLEDLVRGGDVLITSAIGLALFLFGMQRLEAGIRALGLRTFQRWLTRATGSSVASVASGIAITGILQSSSLVSLLVLAFASAEVLPLYNAIGILIGANLGTTMTGWLVTAIGFKLSLSTLMLPLLGVGAAMQWWTGRAPRLGALGWLLFGFGMILMGLDVMRGATEQLTLQLDIGALKGHGIAVYFIAGVVVAACIQSSSATMMLTLMALNSNLLSISAAAAIVIGADLGTTSTTVLASLGGSAVKRQLALAHLIFNIVVDTAALFLLLPLLPTIASYFDVHDPLVMLVGFHSSFNLIGVVIFVPLLRPFANWIATHFTETPNDALRLLNQPPGVPAVALVAIDKALATLAAEFTLLVLHYLRLSPESVAPSPRLQASLSTAQRDRIDPEHRYRRIKASELAILSFALDVEQEKLDRKQRQRLKFQTEQARAFAYSAKTLKDIQEDLLSLANNHSPAVRTLFERHREFLQAALATLHSAYGNSADDARAESLAGLEERNQTHYAEVSAQVNQLVIDDTLTGEELSTALNINRDMHHTLKVLITAARHWRLEEIAGPGPLDGA